MRDFLLEKKSYIYVNAKHNKAYTLYIFKRK